MVSIISWILNLTLNQTKVKNTDMNISMKYSYKLLKSVDIAIEMLKCELQFIFFHSILQGFNITHLIKMYWIILLYKYLCVYVI